MQSPSSTDAISYVRELVDRSYGPPLALLLVNLCLSADLVLAWTSNLRSVTMITPFGDVAPFLLIGMALAGIALLYGVVGFASRLGLYPLARARYRKIMAESQDAHKFRQDVVDLRVLDAYLNVHFDDGLQRGFVRQDRIVRDIDFTRDSAAVAFALWCVQWTTPGILGAFLFELIPFYLYMLIAALIWYAYGWRSLQKGYRLVWTPRRGDEIRRCVNDFAIDESERAREPSIERENAKSLSNYPLRGEPFTYVEPFDGVAEDEWENAN